MKFYAQLNFVDGRCGSVTRLSRTVDTPTKNLKSAVIRPPENVRFRHIKGIFQVM